MDGHQHPGPPSNVTDLTRNLQEKWNGNILRILLCGVPLLEQLTCLQHYFCNLGQTLFHFYTFLSKCTMCM